MECKAKFLSGSVDMITGEAHITFSTPVTADIREFINKAGKIPVLKLEAVKWYDKRGSRANAYFHKLCGLLATARTVDGDIVKQHQVKNEMIASYGQPQILENGNLWYIKTQITPEEALNLENETHLQYVKKDPIDDVYWYIFMRGSHTYNTREMTALINGTVSECKKYNVETIPPDELRRMIAEWRPKKA